MIDLVARATVIGNVALETLPPRRFRNCWRPNGADVAVDLDLARAQRVEEVRRDRDTRFAALDGEWMRAMGKGDAAAAAALDAKRQQLRDAPQDAAAALATATTADAIAAYEPTWPETS